MTEIFTGLSNFGFPIVVATYLLFHFGTKLEKLDTAISDPEKGLIVQIKALTLSVDTLTKTVDRLTEKK